MQDRGTRIDHRADARQVNLVECPSCYVEILIDDPARKGDWLECMSCRAQVAIESVIAPYGERTQSVQLDGRVL